MLAQHILMSLFTRTIIHFALKRWKVNNKADLINEDVMIIISIVLLIIIMGNWSACRRLAFTVRMFFHYPIGICIVISGIDKTICTFFFIAFQRNSEAHALKINRIPNYVTYGIAYALLINFNITCVGSAHTIFH